MGNILKIVILTAICTCTISAKAQINPMAVQYFQNPYLANPAMAGITVGLKLNLGYRNQWSNFPGAPINHQAGLDYQDDKVGWGLSISNEQSGDLSHTKVYGTYAYHLPLNDETQQIHFGLNMGIQNGSYNIQNLIGNPNDPDLVAYNEREFVWDVDFGMAYTNQKLTLEGVMYNIKSQFKKDISNTADFSVYYLAANYKFPLGTWKTQAKLAYRGIKNYVDVADVGMELRTENEKLAFTGIYHTNKSSTFGINYQHNKQWHFLGLYTTTSRQINNYTNGSFELGIQVDLSKIKLKN